MISIFITGFNTVESTIQSSSFLHKEIFVCVPLSHRTASWPYLWRSKIRNICRHLFFIFPRARKIPWNIWHTAHSIYTVCVSVTGSSQASLTDYIPSNTQVVVRPYLETLLLVSLYISICFREPSAHRDRKRDIYTILYSIVYRWTLRHCTSGWLCVLPCYKK
jgi:hypothetical protein